MSETRVFSDGSTKTMITLDIVHSRFDKDMECKKKVMENTNHHIAETETENNIRRLLNKPDVGVCMDCFTKTITENVDIQ